MTQRSQSSKLLDFTILALRWYLAYYMIDYGIAKITGAQFGIYDQTLLDKPLRDVSEFNLAWYLFGLNDTFKIVVATFQILGGILIIINRTALIGALVLLPILINIFLIDLSFTTEALGSALLIRLIFMVLCDLAILWFYKERVWRAWVALTDGFSTRYKYPWWIFLLMPFIGLAIDFVWVPLRLVIDLLMK